MSVSDEPDPCPSPLSWQQVFDGFESESTGWELDRGGYILKGRTWGAGLPLYLLNGLTGTHELYALLVWLLRDEFRLIVYDYPRRKKASAHDFSSDLFAIADLHGDERFNVYATTFGSVVALTALLNQPERIERAVLQGGFAFRKLSLLERLLIRAGRHLPGRLRNVPLGRLIFHQNHLPWFPPFDRGRWEFFLDQTGRVPISAVSDRATMVSCFDVRSRLGEIQQPVLLIRAEGDGRVSGQCHDELEAGLPNVGSEWLHTCGLVPFVTHPHRLAKLLRGFLLGGDEDLEPAASTREASKSST